MPLEPHMQQITDFMLVALGDVDRAEQQKQKQVQSSQVCSQVGIRGNAFAALAQDERKEDEAGMLTSAGTEDAEAAAARARREERRRNAIAAASARKKAAAVRAAILQ